MTISSTTLKNTYTGNNSTTVFAYQFRVLDETEILVTLDGVTQTLTTDYTVSGVGNLNGGNITFLTAPGTGVSIALLQNPDFTQEEDYNELDSFPAESHERALDRAVIRDQTLKEVQQRTLRLPNTTSLTNPEVGDLVANKLLVVNSTGDGIDMSADDFTDIQDDLSTVAGVSADVTTVSGISSDVTDVASVSADVTTVAGISSDVTDAANNIPQANLTATTDPTTSNDTTQGYQPGSKWVNTTLNKVFFCTDATTSAAVWVDIEAVTLLSDNNTFIGDNIFQGVVDVTNVNAEGSGGGNLRTNGGTNCISWGSGGSANSTLGGNMSGASTYKLTNMVDPSAAQDYATKNYVDTEVAAVDTTAGLQSAQVFTSSGTWTKPSGITMIKVTVVGGSAGGKDSSSGGNGGTSSFGSYCSATGGSGSGGATGGEGGTGSGGDVNVTGQRGVPALASLDVGFGPFSGGQSAFGLGSGGYGDARSSSGSGSGGGGGGGGGGGAIEYINVTSVSSVSVTVGAGGTAGGPGATAGDGGIVIVEEYA